MQTDSLAYPPALADLPVEPFRNMVSAILLRAIDEAGQGCTEAVDWLRSQEAEHWAGMLGLDCDTFRNLKLGPRRANDRSGHASRTKAPLLGPRRSDASAISLRFWSHVRKSETGCWLWANRSPGGVPLDFFLGVGKLIAPRRFAYEELAGPMPGKMRLLPTCRNRLCVRPFHMLVVSAGAFNLGLNQSPYAQPPKD